MNENLLSWKTSQTPSLKCSQNNDLFTVSGSSKGNHNLTNPIGLITSDEAIFVGGFGGGNGTDNYYLNTTRISIIYDIFLVPAAVFPA